MLCTNKCKLDTFQNQERENASRNMDLYHLREIYHTSTREKLIDTATKAGLDASKTVRKTVWK